MHNIAMDGKGNPNEPKPANRKPARDQTEPSKTKRRKSQTTLPASPQPLLWTVHAAGGGEDFGPGQEGSGWDLGAGRYPAMFSPSPAWFQHGPVKEPNQTTPSHGSFVLRLDRDPTWRNLVVSFGSPLNPTTKKYRGSKTEGPPQINQRKGTTSKTHKKNEVPRRKRQRPETCQVRARQSSARPRRCGGLRHAVLDVTRSDDPKRWILGPSWVPFCRFFFGGGFPYYNRPHKKRYPYSNLSTGGPRIQ